MSKIKPFLYGLTHKVISHAATAFGLKCYGKYLWWFHDEEYLEAWRKFKRVETTKYVHERRFTLYQFAKSMRNIPGDIAECGVYEGAGSFLMLYAAVGTGKTLHAFDSFEGLANPQSKDVPKKARAFAWKKGNLSASEELVRRNLSRFNNVKYYRGWIPDRFSEVKNKIFSLVHIDVDLYQATYDSMAFFYHRMSPGGVIVCDDYGQETCPGAYRAMQEFMKNKPESIILLTSGQGIIIKQTL